MPPPNLRRSKPDNQELANAEEEVATRALESRFDDERAPPGASTMERLLLVQSMTIREEQRDNRTRIGAVETAKDGRYDELAAQIKVLNDERQQRIWKAGESEKTHKALSQIVVGVTITVLALLLGGLLIFTLRGGCSSIAPPVKAAAP